MVTGNSLSRGLRIAAALAVIALIAKSSLAITVESHNLNLYRRHLDGQWQGIRYASDGNCYFGSSDHAAHEGAAFFKYDPRMREETLLCEDITNLTGDDPYYYPQGKLHSDIVEANGWIYWANHFSSELPGAVDIWPGSHFQAYCLATGEFRDYGVVQNNATCYSGVGVDPARNYGYVYVCPADWSGTGHIFRFDLITGAKTDLGALGGDNTFWFFVDKRGDVWFSQSDDGGTLRVIRGETGAMDEFPNALPPIYTWDTDELVSDSGYEVPNDPPATGTRWVWGIQTNRWIMWMQPLADGDRAVFTEGYYGGRIYIFDSTKDIASGAAFSSPAHIGYSDLGLAVNGNKVFYYQRANRGWAQQEARDFHLLSVDLNPAVSPQIVDYGLIEDQTDRLVWRAPGMMSDGAGSVFMIGDWWTNPGDIGTLRYHWDNATQTESYVDVGRGEQFAVARMSDVLTDDFNDNVQGPIWSLTEQDHDEVWLSETSGRLEVRSAATALAAYTAAYKGRNWLLDTTRDFACRVNYHIAPGSADANELGLRIIKDDSSDIGVFAGRDSSGGSDDYWMVKGQTDNAGFATDVVDRSDTDGTLYIAYDSITDKLYLSKTGYWRRENKDAGDWMYSGLVQGDWAAGRLQVSLEGMVQNGASTGANQYFDNFVADDGALIWGHTVAVSANPETIVAIAVDASDWDGCQNGDTCFTRCYDEGTAVNLTAPATTPHGDHDHNFVRWNVDGVPQSDGQRTITVAVNADTSAIAVYETATWNVTVQSMPIVGAAVTGTPDGTTPYDAQLDDGASVAVTAPSKIAQSGRTWYFYRWMVNGVSQAIGVRSLNVSVWAEVTAVAKYRRVRTMRIYGRSAIYAGARTTYRGTAFFTEGPSKNVTKLARWTDNSPYLRFLKPGVLQSYRVPATRRCTISATYGGGGTHFHLTIRKR